MFEINGAFYGKSFPHALMITNPAVFPEESGHRYVPRRCGFKINKKAHGIQEKMRRKADEKALESQERKLAESLARKEADLLERKAIDDAMEDAFIDDVDKKITQTRMEKSTRRNK